jgi:hypothetical protein
MRLEKAKEGKERVERKRKEHTRGRRKSRWKESRGIYGRTTKFKENEVKKKVQEGVIRERKDISKNSKAGWNLKEIKEVEAAERG